MIKYLKQGKQAEEKAIDNQKVKEILNWEPVYSDLNNIIETAYKWQKKQTEK